MNNFEYSYKYPHDVYWVYVFGFYLISILVSDSIGFYILAVNGMS